MRKYRAVTAVFVCIALIFCALSMSSFASLMPFAGEKPQTSLPAETVGEEETESVSAESSFAEAADVKTAESAEDVENATESTEIKADVSVSAEMTAEGKTSVKSAEKELPSAESDEKDYPSPKLDEKAESAAEPVSEKTEKTAAADLKDSSFSLNADTVGHLSSAADVKSYTFTLTERGVLRYKLKHEKNTIDAVWNVSLYQQYNSNGYDGEEKWRLIDSLDTNASKTEESSPNTGLQKGVYRIDVCAGQGFSSASFTLNVSFIPGTDYEIEYNDTAARYTEIYPGVPVKGSSRYVKNVYDADYYMFRMNSAGSVQIRLDHMKAESLSVYWRVALYNADGKELYSENASSASAVTNSGAIGLAPGCYFVCVSGRVYSPADYTLTVTASKNDSFESEPNATVSTADALALNGSISGALTSSSGNADTDVFAVKTLRRGYIRLTFTAEKGTDTDYSWHTVFADSAGHRLSETRVAPVLPEAKTAFIGVAPGTYYVTVDNKSLHKNNGTYVIGCEFTPADNWETEFNGSTALADVLEADTAMSGTLADCDAEFDDDFYKIVLPYDSVIQLSLSHEASKGDREIYSVTLNDSSGTAMPLLDLKTGEPLLSKDGAQVTSFNSLESDAEVSAVYLLKAGTYYVRVTSGLFSSDIIYQLTYTLKTGG